LTLACAVHAQQPARPPIQTTKVEGTDNVYIFRNVGHQSMFIVTPEGVIATDPIAYGKPTGGQAYLDQIRKVTEKPVKYVIYSHHHYDHIAGGKAFKDAGATFIAHHRVKERLEPIKDPHTVLPDEVVPDTGRTITLGGTTLELLYLGPNHSDSNLVMRLPKERIVFIVDTDSGRSGAGARDDGLVPHGVRSVHRKGARDGLGPAHSRPPRPWRPSRHEEGRAGPAHAVARSVGGNEEARPGRKVLGPRREGVQACRLRKLARIRSGSPMDCPTLLRILGTGYMKH